MNLNECNAVDEGWTCTLNLNHDGHHEAWSETMPIVKPFHIWPNTIENARDCKHGRLKRKCFQCDDEKEILELKQQIKRCHGIMQGLISKMEQPTDKDGCEIYDDAQKELNGEFCHDQCTSACDATIKELETEIEQLKNTQNESVMCEHCIAAGNEVNFGARSKCCFCGEPTVAYRNSQNPS